jgi:hypothetical protein
MTKTQLQVLTLLKQQDWTASQLAVIVERHPDTISDILRAFHGKAYIKDWTRESGSYAAVWAFGDLPHVRRPAAKTKKAKRYEKTEGVLDRKRLSANYVTGERIWGI